MGNERDRFPAQTRVEKGKKDKERFLGISKVEKKENKISKGPEIIDLIDSEEIVEKRDKNQGRS